MISANTKDPLSLAVARVEGTTIAIGVAAAIYELATADWRSAVAIIVGSIISWLNYRWLRSGVLALAPMPPTSLPATEAPQTGAAIADSQTPSKPASPKVFVKFIARIALLLVALYVILSRSLLPAAPLLAGLFAAVAAVVIQMVYLLATGGVAKSA